MTDALNAGLPSDRFEVEWWLNAPRVLARVPPSSTVLPPQDRPARLGDHPCETSAESPQNDWATLTRAMSPVFDVTFDARGLPRIERVVAPRGDSLWLEIPADLGALKAAAPDLARAWRLDTRAAFQRLFDAGYVAADFVYARAGPSRAAYILTRQPLELG
jgi:predicted GNAT superfamily acetyltransferase